MTNKTDRESERNIIKLQCVVHSATVKKPSRTPPARCVRTGRKRSFHVEKYCRNTRNQSSIKRSKRKIKPLNTLQFQHKGVVWCPNSLDCSGFARGAAASVRAKLLRSSHPKMHAGQLYQILSLHPPAIFHSVEWAMASLLFNTTDCLLPFVFVRQDWVLTNGMRC